MTYLGWSRACASKGATTVVRRQMRWRHRAAFKQALLHLPKAFCTWCLPLTLLCFDLVLAIAWSLLSQLLCFVVRSQRLL